VSSPVGLMSNYFFSSKKKNGQRTISSLGATTRIGRLAFGGNLSLRKKKKKKRRRLVPNRPGTHPRVCVSAGEVLTDQDHACVRDNQDLTELASEDEPTRGTLG